MGECGCMLEVGRCKAHRDDVVVVLQDGHISDDMIERAASAIALENDHNPNLIPRQLWSAVRLRYRRLAVVALEAALENAGVPADEMEGEDV